MVQKLGQVKSSSSGTSIFAYDGDNLIEEVNASGAVVARYTQGQNIDEPLAMSRGSVTSYYEADGLGSVTSLTNGAGALAQTYTFDSFGKLTGSSGSLTNPFQYTARESDPETGLYYYRGRYYGSGVGRFISEDPQRFDGGVDFYRYASDNPINNVDPFGLTPCWTKPVKITKVVSCATKFVSAQGTCYGQAEHAVQDLCDDIRKDIQKNGSFTLDPQPCAGGCQCNDMQIQTHIEVENAEFTVTRTKKFPPARCTVTFRITGVFEGTGEIGNCGSCKGGGC